MKLRYSHILAAGLSLLLTSTTLHAQQTSQLDVPKTVSYQGLLTSSDGTPLPDGRHTITVTLYGDQAGTQIIWRDSYEAQTIGGLFNLYLGSGEQALPKGQQLNRPLWVGTSVDGGAEMGPLTPLSASPYALNVSDGAITGVKLAAGAVTADKVDMEYVSGISIDGKPVTAKGTVLELRSSDGISLDYSDETQTLTIGASTSQKKASEEKGPRTLSTPDAWNSQGDLSDGAVQVRTASGDWIGTTGTTGPNGNGEFNFIIKVHDEQIMKYQHRTDANTPNIVGGHSANAIGDGIGNVIAGGGSSTNPHAVGDNADYNVVSGGEDNTIGDNVDYGFIGGGSGNIVEASYGTIVGGKSQAIRINAPYSFIGGGSDNYITQDYSTIAGGGNVNSTKARASGDINYIKSEYGFVGGGRGNWIDTNAHDATIGGGIGNAVYPNTYNDTYIPKESGGTIAGGGGNIVRGYHGTVAGGHHNEANGDFSFVGGGGKASHGAGGNEANGDYSVIGGGQINIAEADGGVITGGYFNTIPHASSTYGTIGGGYKNWIGKDDTAAAMWATIAGGDSNIVTANHGTVGGGKHNKASNTATVGGGLGNNALGVGATISGGSNQKAESPYSTVSGGHENTIPSDASNSTIGGGYNNQINTTAGPPDYAYFTIGGGTGNVIETDTLSLGMSTIAGGVANFIKPGGHMATIPGGDWLIAQSWAQTVVGGMNEPKGSVPFRYQGTSDRNQPIFIVGNGSDTANRSNAFEVSYNGHSIVFDKNGSGGWLGGGARGVVTGGTYTDNIIYGWAEVDIQGEVLTACGNFGIADIKRHGPGIYRVTLNVVNPESTASATINCGAVTATLGSGLPPLKEMPQDPQIPTTVKCAQITTSDIVGNVFDVYISSLAAPGIECTEGIDLPFKFHVTGRVD